MSTNLLCVFCRFDIPLRSSLSKENGFWNDFCLYVTSTLIYNALIDFNSIWYVGMFLELFFLSLTPFFLSFLKTKDTGVVFIRIRHKTTMCKPLRTQTKRTGRHLYKNASL